MNNEHFFNQDVYTQDSYSNISFQEQYAINNPTIKEKLNLHVKRRLLETAPFGASYNSTTNNGISYGSYDESICGPSKKSKRGRKSKKTSTVTSGFLNANNLESKAVLKNFGTSSLNPPSITSSNNSPQSVKGNKIKDKEKNQEINQFVKILDEKKLALMQDPSIINLLDHITMKLREKNFSSQGN